MLATGCRIGEALAARVDTNSDGGLLLDLEARTWEVNSTVVRAAGRGLVIQPRPKTKAGWRIVALPSSAVQTAWQRFDRHQQPMLFPAPVRRALRDPTNVSGDLRVLIEAELSSVIGAGPTSAATPGQRSATVTARRRLRRRPVIWSCGSRSCAPARSSRACSNAADGSISRCSQ
jgi:hypothetical protein